MLSKFVHTMKFRIALIFFLLLYLNGFSQEEGVVRRLLQEKYPQEKGQRISNADWDYYGDSPKRLSFPVMEKYFPKYNFYCAELAFSYDTHYVQQKCVMLFDKEKKDLILVEPPVAKNLDQPFYKR